MNIGPGVDAQMQGKSIVKWLAEGGETEDKPRWYLGPLRSTNHFHNPLVEDLAEAGFGGILGSGAVDGTSALVWAQAERGTQAPGGWYSWHDARQYYRNALTASLKATREQGFADTFRAVGQVMHLVQDMSVPEHARNDDHYLRAYEGWLVDPGTQGSVLIEEALANPYLYDMVWLSQPSPFPLDAPIPIARLFDVNRYDGSNPAVTVAPGIGLAEYANANFVSGGTLFPAGIPYPDRITSVTIADCAIDDPLIPGGTILRPYFIKTGDGEHTPLVTCGTVRPVQGYHLAGVDFFKVYREQAGVSDNDFVTLPILDDNVYADYARLLVPRAVGYSTALLHYFFRGEIDLIPDTGNADRYLLKNNSVEALQAGLFSLYRDDPDGNRTRLLDIPLAGPLPAFGERVVTIPNLVRGPEWKNYTLVYTGRLGEENGAVIGKALNHNWREEWDAGLKGRHPWLATGIDLVTENPPQAVTALQVGNGRLVMENRRPAATRLAQVNHVVLGEADVRSGDLCYLGNDVLPCDFTREFPRIVTPGTMLRVKIDKSTINQVIPAQSCLGNTQPLGAWQGLFLRFTLADGRGFSLHLGASGHEGRLWPYQTVPLGAEYAVNLYELLARLGAGAVPVTLDVIDIAQQLLPLCQPAAGEHVQQLEIDYVRFEER